MDKSNRCSTVCFVTVELIVLVLGKAAVCAAGKDGGAAVGCKLSEYQHLAVGGVNAMQVCVSKKTANKAQASCYAELC